MARKSLRPHLNQIRTWTRQGRTDAWVAHQLEVTVQQIASFKRESGLLDDEPGAVGAAAADEEIDLRAEADSLARANELRSALLAAVSHDLRTPLASIKAASSSLLSEQLSFGPEETRILLQTIDDESDRLNSLVENLLDMSRQLWAVRLMA